MKFELAISSSTEGWIRQQEGAPFLQKHAKTVDKIISNLFMN
jgi:hypothetical protein